MRRLPATAGDAMLADGWNRHASKFHEVRMRRARKLWALK